MTAAQPERSAQPMPTPTPAEATRELKTVSLERYAEVEVFFG